jgi:predicted esterase
MRFTTEEFVAAVVEEAAKHVKVDRRRVLTVSWSSSGPACYRIASLADTPVTGSLVAMSVWKPDQMEPLAQTRSRPFFLLHAPDDATCPFADAERARDALRKAGAKVEFATYEGGHGWAGESEEQARRGLRWLAEQARAK